MGAAGVPPSADTVVQEKLQALTASIATFAQVRGRLFAVELREEIQHRSRLLLLAALAGACLHVALLLLTALLVAAFWESHRMEAIGAAAGAYLASAMVLVLVVRAQLARQTPPFAASLEELRLDLASLGGAK